MDFTYRLLKVLMIISILLFPFQMNATFFDYVYFLHGTLIIFTFVFLSGVQEVKALMILIAVLIPIELLASYERYGSVDLYTVGSCVFGAIILYFLFKYKADLKLKSAFKAFASN